MTISNIIARHRIDQQTGNLFPAAVQTGGPPGPGWLTVYASNFGYSIPTAFKRAPDPILALVMANGALPIPWGNFAHIIDIAALCNAPAGYAVKAISVGV